jgi:hypothetical protein
MPQHRSLRELLNEDPLGILKGKRSRSRYSDDVAKARKGEQMRRRSAAYELAVRGMHELYPEDWKRLFAEAKEIINEDRGPLPGD